MKPTEQQLKDPQWWDKNCPSYEHVLMVSRAYTALTEWVKMLGIDCFVGNDGRIYQDRRLFDIYERPVKASKFIPEAGEWCEYRSALNWYKARFQGECERTGYFVLYVGGVYEEIKPSEFRPIKSERDVFIERASRVSFCGKENISNHYGDLFDAGARFNDE